MVARPLGPGDHRRYVPLIVNIYEPTPPHFSSKDCDSMTGRVANKYFSRAFRWQRIFLLVVIALIFVQTLQFIDKTVYRYAMLVLLVCAIIAILAVCFYVFRGSVSSRGMFYSVIHVGLIILLTPVCFVGVFVIPSLTNGDALRLRDSDRQHPNGT